MNRFLGPNGKLGSLPHRFCSLRLPPPLIANPKSAFRNPQFETAFTLIELLVVIAIIAVLAGLAFPVMTAVRERGDQTKCVSNLRQVVAATTLAANDNDGRYPNMRGYVWETGAAWINDLLAPYISGGVTVPEHVADICVVPAQSKIPIKLG